MQKLKHIKHCNTKRRTNAILSASDKFVIHQSAVHILSNRIVFKITFKFSLTIVLHKYDVIVHWMMKFFHSYEPFIWFDPINWPLISTYLIQTTKIYLIFPYVSYHWMLYSELQNQLQNCFTKNNFLRCNLAADCNCTLQHKHSIKRFMRSCSVCFLNDELKSFLHHLTCHMCKFEKNIQSWISIVIWRSHFCLKLFSIKHTTYSTI